jgi:hypothetical protein
VRGVRNQWGWLEVLPFRVVLVKDDPARSVTTVVVTLERSPDVGSTIEIPYVGTAVVRHVLSGHDDHGVIIAGAPAPS